VLSLNVNISCHHRETLWYIGFGYFVVVNYQVVNEMHLADGVQFC